MKRIPLFMACIALFCVAGAKKNPPLTIRFHSEGSKGDMEKSVQPMMFMNPPHEGMIEVIPLISEREIIAFYPYSAKNNSGTMGASFKLDGHGTALLETFTIMHPGKTVAVMVNGRQVIDLVADRPIHDGIISIPSGLSASEIESMRAEFRIIGKKTDPKKARMDKFKKVMAGEFDTSEEDAARGPSQPKATPIPVSTPPPAATPSPKR
ncbi:MAG: hypothetical protein ABIP97_11255 [Chthoniobacterales bacterium]